MITDELIEFIKNKLEKGATYEEVEETLISGGGWLKEDVESAFRSLGLEVEKSDSLIGSEQLVQGDTQLDMAYEAQPARRNKFVLPAVIGVVLLALGAGVYFFAGDLMRSRFARPDTVEGFLLAFAEGVKDLDRFSYEVVLSAHQEPRDGEVQPIVLNDPAHSEEKIAMIERDIERVSGISAISNALSNFYWQNEHYPDSLDSLDYYQELDLGAYTYFTTDDGLVARLTVQFEARETVSYFAESRYGSQEQAIETDFENSTATFVFSTENNNYFPVPYGVDSILPKSAVVQGLESLGMLVRFLPDRFKGEVVFSGSVGVTEKLPDSENKLSADIDWGDLSFRVGAEAIMKDGVFYGRINNFPSIPFFNIDSIRGQWIRATEEDLEESYGLTGFLSDGFDVSEIREDRSEETEKALQILREAIIAHKPLTLKEAPRTENLDDGRSAVRYSLGLDGEKIAGFYEYVYEEAAGAFYEGDEAESFRIQAEKELSYLQSTDFLEVVDYLNKNADLVIWLDSKTGHPVQILQEIVYVADPGTSDDFLSLLFGSGSGGGSLNSQLVYSTKITLSNINRQVEIQAPEEFLTPEEVENIMYGGSAREMGADASVKANLNTSRAQAELYYEDNDFAYSGVCSDTDYALQDIMSLVKENAKDEHLSCFDSAEAWAAEAKLHDDTFYCIDSTGSAEVQQSSTISSVDMVCG